MKFDVKAELVALQNQTKRIRKTHFFKSKLDPYKTELLLLHNEGASIAELRRWLQAKKILVAWSTVSRWIEKHA